MKYILYIICNVYKYSKDCYDLCFYSIVNFSTSKGETSDRKFNHRMSVAHVAARDHAGCPGLGPKLWPGGCPMVIPLSGPHWWKWPALPPGVLVLPGPEQLPRDMSGSTALWYTRFELIFMTPPRAVRMTRICSVTWEHLSVWGPRHCWPILIWVACAATYGHGDIWAWSTVYGHVWVLSPAVAVVRMSMASVNTGVHKNHTSRYREVVLNQSCPSVILGLLALNLTEYYSKSVGPDPQGRATSPKHPNPDLPHLHPPTLEKWLHPSPWLYNSPGQHTSADPVVACADEPAPRGREQESWPCLPSLICPLQ